MGVGPALQQIGLCPAAFRTREPIRPTPLRQKERATRFVGKPTLEIEKGGVSPGHATGLCRDRSPYASETWDNGISLEQTVTETPEIEELSDEALNRAPSRGELFVLLRVFSLGDL